MTTFGAEPPPPPAPRRGIPVGLIVTGVLAVVVLAVGVVLAVRPGTTPAPTAVSAPASTAAGPAPDGAAQPAGASSRQPVVTASCVAPPSQDAGGSVVDYGAGNAIDGRDDTAWRCDGDGLGQQLRVDPGSEVVVREVGMIPGYAKTDPVDGADRYAQNRRIAQVRYDFDDGTSVTQSFDTAPGDRSVQVLPIGAVTTRTVTITVLASAPGLPVGDYPPSDRVAISELLIGVGNGE